MKEQEAIEEFQQYRALGTVEELKIMKESALSGLELLNIWAALERLKKYEAIGNLEELREAREKQIPKKLEIGNDNGNLRKCCARCKCFVFPASRYCSKCGQNIDWND